MDYPVIFREEGDDPLHGSLGVDSGTLVLRGRAAGVERELRVRVADVATIRISRSRREQLSGHHALVLERHGSPPVLVSPLGAGVLAELADLLGSLAAEARSSEHVAVVLPLKPDAHALARRLIERGPPFDLDELPGIRHSVYLGRASVVFVFEGEGARGVVERLLRRPGLWRAGVAWRECAAGRPHVTSSALVPGDGAELVYTSRPAT